MKTTGLFIISHSIILRMRNVSDKVVKEIKTHILCSITLYESRAICEIMWKNILERGRPQMTIWRWAMCAGYLRLHTHTHTHTHTLSLSLSLSLTHTHTHTHTHTMCNTYFLSTATIIARRRVNVTVYVYIHVHCLLLNTSLYFYICLINLINTSVPVSESVGLHLHI